MTVKIAHARHDEHNGSRGGKAGDQGGEVTITNWYLHSKGWYVYRCKSETKRKKIAEAARRACNNQNIGYDQYQRDTLFNAVRNKDFDPARVTTRVETDCSALVRVCIAYAYGRDLVGNIRTAIMSNALMRTGEFVKYTDSAHCKKSSLLKEGDILCTRTTGHTVVVVNDGAGVPLDIDLDEPQLYDNELEGEYAVSAKTSLNLRTGAGTNHKRIASIPRGTKVQADGYYTEVSGKPWMVVYLKMEGRSYRGYVSAAYLTR